jgi:hypothetical protein
MLTEEEEAGTVVAGCAVGPMYGVTVYVVIGLPPVLEGAIQETVAEAFPAVAVTPLGAPGTVLTT